MFRLSFSPIEDAILVHLRASLTSHKPLGSECGVCGSECACSLMGCDTVQSDWQVTAFQKNIMLPIYLEMEVVGRCRSIDSHIPDSTVS